MLRVVLLNDDNRSAQRIRDVRQGPDGLLCVLTAENRGALLRIGPADVRHGPRTVVDALPAEST